MPPGAMAFPEFIAGKAGGISTMLILKDCGHMPQFEKTGEVIHVIKEFLDANAL